MGADLYDAARPGATGVADVWRGRVTRLRVGARSDDQWSYWSLGIAWVLGWIGVMLVAGWGLPLVKAPLGIVVGAWWAGVVLFVVVHGWRPAPWVVPAVLAGAVLALRVSGTVGSARQSRSRRYG